MVKEILENQNKPQIARDTARSYSFKESKFKVYETYDYQLFSFIRTNRVIDESRVKKIADEIKTEGLLFSPIIVNENLEIIEGQHRAKALIYLESLGHPYPLYFIIQPGYSTKEMIVFNKNLDKWKKRDYLRHYVEVGSEAYIHFNDFLDSFPWLPQTGAEAIFSANSGGVNTNVVFHGKNVRKKTFENGSMLVPSSLDVIYDWARKIEKIGDYYDGFSRANFIRTMVTLLKNENFNYDHFIKKLSGSGGKRYPLFDVGSVELYRERINMIYNHNVHSKGYVELRLPKKA